MGPWIIQMTIILFVFICCSQAKRNRMLYCSACGAIVDELTHSINLVDPKKTINIGGFRLDADGTIKDKKVPLARSETHLSELLDAVCESMSDYALYVDPQTQRKRYKRFAPRSAGSNEGFPDIKNFQFDGPEAPNALKFACETIVEELEDEIIALFSKNTENAQEELCNNVSDYCKGSSNTNDEL
ncbi:protein canopy-1 [Corythoichthys intestinalis]|uniref:protein canopy-1 n=1 Tax=Corythoichthys intestinalis TaxID=161448 RepID=UPI0025A5A482|nr:protein canopy-1 [Corythoichthys intestinalis]XP_057712958.1 protein canopy-1 [Corythoichthys intestinalis]XP_061794939.1 protein canopy-1-like [Nerophis lumbriciformis]